VPGDSGKVRNWRNTFPCNEIDIAVSRQRKPSEYENAIANPMSLS